MKTIARFTAQSLVKLALVLALTFLSGVAAMPIWSRTGGKAVTWIKGKFSKAEEAEAPKAEEPDTSN